MDSREFDLHLIEKCKEFYYDPVGFIRYMFPWGEEGTLLEDEEGLDVWQEDYLNDLSGAMQADPEALQRFAVASTHGSGKTFLVALFILWFLSTRPQSNIVLTANTDTQLKTKTFREVKIWHELILNKHWFNISATKISHVSDDAWICNAIPNNPEKPEAIAGAHAKHMAVIMDESSGIDHRIYEALYGAMSTAGALWLTFGNGTKNNGPFFDSFHGQSHRWNTRHIDGRYCKRTNKELIQQFIEDYGIDSDIVKVRWLGLFPSASDDVLIPSAAVDSAAMRDLGPIHFTNYPVLFGVDVARSGTDESVIVRRQGPKVQILGRYIINDLMELSKKVVDLAAQQKPDHIFVDETGLGAGVFDRLNQLGLPVTGVNFATRAVDKRSYAQTRSELWGNMKEWLVSEVDIPNDRDLITQLKQQPYGYNDKMQIQLLSKKHMKSQGLKSPDIADALAVTFYSDVQHLMRPKTSKVQVIQTSAAGWT